MSTFTAFKDAVKDSARTSLKLLLGRGSSRSYSQNGEDAVIRHLTSGIECGVYVDVGAFHPIQYSNTYALYRRGWKGIVIDPNPRWKPLYRIFRPRDTFVNAGVSAVKSAMTYHMFADPAYNTLSAEQAEIWSGATAGKGNGDSKAYEGRKQVGTREIKTGPLSQILADNDVKRIDVLSIDVEGLDLEVLSSHDWNIPTRIVAVEDHDFDLSSPEQSEVYRFMRQKGYALEAFVGFTLIFSMI